MVEKKPRKKAAPRVKQIKSGIQSCVIDECENYAEVSPPGVYCTSCRKALAVGVRVSYDNWKKSRGLPIETVDEELARLTGA